MRFLTDANLPTGKISLAAVCECEQDITTELEKLNISSLELPPNPFVDKRLSGHADLSLLHIEGNIAAVSKSCTDILKSKGFEVVVPDGAQSEKYPFDCILNALILKKKVFANTSALDKKISAFLLEKGFEIIHINQGYSKCMTAVINENAVITCDKSVKQAADAHKIDALIIRQGFIRLDGFEYGFIGGCCGLIDRNILAFSGKIENHPDYVLMRDFALSHSVKLLSLTEEKLKDIGGILPIQEGEV